LLHHIASSVYAVSSTGNLAVFLRLTLFFNL